MWTILLPGWEFPAAIPYQGEQLRLRRRADQFSSAGILWRAQPYGSTGLAAYNNSRKTTTDPAALYIVWAGANNLKDILVPPSGTPLTSEEVSYALTKTASDVGSAVETLANYGAKNLLVPNLPYLGGNKDNFFNEMLNIVYRLLGQAG